MAEAPITVAVAAHSGGFSWTPATDGPLYITGACGSGKTTLLRRVAAAAHSAGCEVIALEPTFRGGRRHWPRATRVIRGAKGASVLAAPPRPDNHSVVLLVDGVEELGHQIRTGVGGAPNHAWRELLARACGRAHDGVLVAVSSKEPRSTWLGDGSVSIAALGPCPRPGGWADALGQDDLSAGGELAPGRGWFIRTGQDPTWLDMHMRKDGEIPWRNRQRRAS